MLPLSVTPRRLRSSEIHRAWLKLSPEESAVLRAENMPSFSPWRSLSATVAQSGKAGRRSVPHGFVHMLDSVRPLPTVSLETLAAVNAEVADLVKLGPLSCLQ